MSSSWSDLPLDLLISIKNKLEINYQRSDLISFRSVCSQWRSAMPAPNPFPRYMVSFVNNVNTNIVDFIIDSNSSSRTISMPLLFSSSPLFFICSSNGWLAFINRDNETLHLFDPTSNHQLIFPPLSPKLLRHYNKFKLIVANASRLYLSKVIVSSNADAGVAVAGIVEIRDRTGLVLDRKFVFCKYGDGQRWSLLMERSRGIRDIALAGDGRFYAIGSDWELFMLDESSPLITLKKLKLWFPKKQILEPDPDNDRTEKRISITCLSLAASGRSDLKVYGSSWKYRFGGMWICLKLDLAKLCCSGKNNIDVACEVHWSYKDQSPFHLKQYFTPSLRKLHIP